MPGADLRGPRDLPVLIAADPVALAAEAAAGTVDLDVPAGLEVTPAGPAGFDADLGPDQVGVSLAIAD